jgi:Flp pilus assembly protein TadG
MPTLRFLHSRAARRGSAGLEFAIGSGVLIAVFTGTFQFGYTFYRYNALANAVNNAARYASLRPYDSPTSTPSDAFRNAVKNMVVYGSPSGGTSPIAPGLTTSQVNLTVTFFNAVPSTVAVSINGYTINSVFANMALNGKPISTYPYIGIYSPY